MGSDDVIEKKKPFDLLDLKSIAVFGSRRVPGSKLTWIDLAEQGKTFGWSKDGFDRRGLEESLARDVDSSYFRAVSFAAEDLGSEIKWHASFINDKGLWELEIVDSPRAEIEPSQMKDFFSSDLFKKTAKIASAKLETARSLIQEVIQQHLESGELLDVDEVKLAALVHWMSDKQWMENLRTGKFMDFA